MSWRIVLLAAFAAVAAACGNAQSSEAVAPAAGCRPTLVRISVMNGDTHRPVRGARVSVANRVFESNARGQVWHRLKCRRSVPVRISAKGYLPKLARPPFKQRRRVVVRVYRRSLQWTMYGATPERTQAQKHIAIRPPFRVAWTRGLGALIEFPAVVSEGVAYIANYRGTVRAISMRDGKVGWRRNLRQKNASSLAIWGDKLVLHTMRGRVWVLKRSNGKVLWSKYVGSAIESSPVVRYGVDYFGTHNGRLYALDLERRRVRWVRGGNCKITSSAAITGRMLFIGDYCGQGARRPHEEWAENLDPRCEREGLRHAGGNRPARVRAVVDRRVLDGVLDRRPLPLACRHGLLRLLVARGLGRPRVLRLVQRADVRRFGIEGTCALVGARRRPDLRCGHGRRRRRVRGLDARTDRRR